MGRFESLSVDHDECVILARRIESLTACHGVDYGDSLSQHDVQPLVLHDIEYIINKMTR